MKRWLFICGGGAVVVIVIFIAAGIFLVSSLDTLIQAAVETVGSEATQAKVSLGKVEISATSGRGTLGQLVIGNPAGFKTESAFELGEVSVSIDTGSLTGDIIVIREIVITAPRITYEMASGGSNIDAIQKNVEAYMARMGVGGGGSDAGAGEKAADGEEGPKLIIEDLYVRGGQVGISATMLEGRTMTVPLPDIHLQDIGKEEGATPGEAINEVLASVRQRVAESVASAGIGDALKSLTEGAAGAGGAVLEGAKGVGDALQEGAKGAGEKLKGLFGN